MKAISFLIILSLIYSCSSQKNRKLTYTELVRETLDSKLDEFRSCYLESESYRGRHEQDNGTASFSFSITADGTVSDEKIDKSDFKDPNLHACWLGQLKPLKFSPTPDGKTALVQQPINFYRRNN